MEKPPCVRQREPMNWCARALYEQQIDGRIDLPREWWKGWKIVKDSIRGPGGIRFHRRQLEALWRLGRMRERAARRQRRDSGITPAGSRSMLQSLRQRPTSTLTTSSRDSKASKAGQQEAMEVQRRSPAAHRATTARTSRGL